MSRTELDAPDQAVRNEIARRRASDRPVRITTIRAGAALAAPRRPGALALPRAAGDARMARRRGALQADVDRRVLGDPAALPDDGRLHVRLRALRELPVEGCAVPDLHVLGAPAVDVLRDFRGTSPAAASSPIVDSSRRSTSRGFFSRSPGSPCRSWTSSSHSSSSSG